MKCDILIQRRIHGSFFFFFPSFYFCPVRLNMLLNMVQQVSSYSPTLLTMPLRMTWGCTQTPGTSLAQGYSEGPFTSPWGLGETPFPRGTPLTVSIHFHPPPPLCFQQKQNSQRIWLDLYKPSFTKLSLILLLLLQANFHQGSLPL